MALGLNNETSDGGDFLGYIKYDTKAGRLFDMVEQQDASGNWEKVPTEMGPQNVFAIDLENIQVGWISYAGTPDFKMVQIGQPLPPKPSDNHKQGFRVLVFSPQMGVKTFSATAKACRVGLDQLHDAYLAQAAANPGKVPVVRLAGTTPIVTTTKHGSNTNYQPNFEIGAWTDRTPDVLAALPLGDLVSDQIGHVPPVQLAPAQHTPPPTQPAHAQNAADDPFTTVGEAATKVAEQAAPATQSAPAPAQTDDFANFGAS